VPFEGLEARANRRDDLQQGRHVHRLREGRIVRRRDWLNEAW